MLALIYIYIYTSQGCLELSQDLMHNHRRRETFIIYIYIYILCMSSAEGALYNPGILLLEAARNVEAEFELKIQDAAVNPD